MTSYGREVTERFSSELGNLGITIISGLARGIDTTAHKACISVGGKTVAVLGNGLDTVYPAENTVLAEEIIKTGGAIISEYPLGYPALPVNFAVRNRIVSGLSDAVIVIEGAEKVEHSLPRLTRPNRAKPCLRFRDKLPHRFLPPLYSC